MGQFEYNARAGTLLAVRVRRAPVWVGKLGMGLGASGIAIAWGGVLLSDFFAQLIAMLIGSTLYLAGAFMTVLAFDYRAKSPSYWLVRAGRLAIAGAVITMIVRSSA
ncbi:MAG: hypothetical protein JNM85_10465 [Chthonomonas sp.]|nr:hypothetical protein [Chthonomonas sp.]